MANARGRAGRDGRGPADDVDADEYDAPTTRVRALDRGDPGSASPGRLGEIGVDDPAPV